MAKKKEETSEGLSILDKIKKCSDFEILSGEKIKTFTSRPTIKTPIKAIDGLIGGGIPFGTIADLFGPKGSGKSSFAYEVLGNFQKQYKDGIVMIIDSESSIDALRVSALGLDPNRVTVLRGQTKESGYKQILSVLKTLEETKESERVPITILWDSLNGTATDAQTEKENVNGGGMAEDSRINKEYLKQINQHLGGLDLTLLLINQVSSKIGLYVSGFNESGGNALQHAIHLKLEFADPKTDLKENASIIGAAKTTNGRVKITKNKLGPITDYYPFVIDNTKGGVIDPIESFVQFLEDKNLAIENNRGRYSFLPKFFVEQPLVYQIIDKKYPKLLKSAYYKDLLTSLNDDYYNDKGVLLDSLILTYVIEVGKEYSLQKRVVADYRKELEDNIINYVKDNGMDLNFTLPQEYIDEVMKED